MKIDKKQFNFQNLVIILFLLTTIFSIIYTFSKDDYYISDGQSNNYTYYYKLFFFTLFIIFFIILQLSNKVKTYFLIISFSLILGLYFLEIMIRSTIFEKQNLLLPKNFDQRNAAEVINDLREKNKKSFPLIAPTNFLSSDGITILNKDFGEKKIFPLGGVSKVLTPLCNEIGDWIVYKSDRYGCNNPDKVWNNPKIDYLVIGDSFAHGACARPNFDIRGQIQKKTKKKTITLGYGGNGPLLSMASYLEFNSLLNPEYLVWIYYEHSDLVDLSKEMNGSKILKNYFNKNYSQNLIAFQKDIDEGLKSFYNKKIFLSFLKLQRTRKQTIDIIINNFFVQKKDKVINEKTSKKILITDKKQLKNFELVLDKINKEVLKNNQKLLFVYLPSFERYFYKKNIINFYSKEIFEILNRNNVLYIDIIEKFDNHDDPISYFPLRQSAHYTEEAYDMITNEILKKFDQ